MAQLGRLKAHRSTSTLNFSSNQSFPGKMENGCQTTFYQSLSMRNIAPHNPPRELILYEDLLREQVADYTKEYMQTRESGRQGSREQGE